MYRFLFTPRWLAFHLLVVVAIVAMINLGFWQLRRLDERRDLNAAVAARSAEPAVPLAELLASGESADDLVWRRVTATGTWLEDQVIVFNRSQGGRPGDNVLTALALGDGSTVLVNRGFVPLGTPAPPPPPGQVEVLGTVRASQARTPGGLTDQERQEAGEPLAEVRRVDIAALAPQLPGEVAPVYLDLVDTTPPPTAGDPTPVPPPDLSEGPHLSYAVQWFLFAGCVAVGWVLAVRRSLALRRRTSVAAETSSQPRSGLRQRTPGRG